MSNVNLPPEMQRFVNAATLEKNAKEFPHMGDELSPKTRAQLGAVTQRLVQVPIVHFSQAPYESVRQHGLLSNRDADEAGMINRYALAGGGKTFALDRSLGLDSCSFSTWGDFVSNGGAGIYSAERAFLIDPSVLLKPETFVTPQDVVGVDVEELNVELPYSRLDKEMQEAIQELYFGNMVTGRAWLEIVARDALHHVLENDGDPYSLKDDMGEIKHYGTVSPKYIEHKRVDASDSKQMDHVQRRILEVGFVIDRHITQSDAPDINERREEARGEWQRILEDAPRRQSRLRTPPVRQPSCPNKEAPAAALSPEIDKVPESPPPALTLGDAKNVSGSAMNAREEARKIIGAVKQREDELAQQVAEQLRRQSSRLGRDTPGIEGR